MTAARLQQLIADCEDVLRWAQPMPVHRRLAEGTLELIDECIELFVEPELFEGSGDSAVD